MKRLFLIFHLFSFLAVHAQQFSLIKDINPGPESSNICYLTNVNNTLFFAANDGVNGMELWKSNGTAAGTVLVKDIYTGPGNSSIGYLTNVNGTLFFVANSGNEGNELWKSDGTAAGTVLVKDIRAGSMGSNPSDLVNVNGILFFAADDGVKGTELWRSDGTAAGTVLVKDINPSSASAYPQSMACVNGTLFFSATNGVNGTELWKSDGTTAGTVLVKDIWPGIDDGYPSDLTVVGNKLFFSATNGTNGVELWKSDGTTAGTLQVKDIQAGAGDAFPYDLVNVAGELFFSADNGTNGIEPWKSDGTTAGTTLVKDVWPGVESGAAGNFSKLLNKLIFIGNDGVNGYRTWESDGTNAGTEMAAGIADIGNGNLRELVETGNNIYASIDQASIGTELWGISFSVVLPVRILEFEGRLEKSDAILDWKCENEMNIGSFIVERSRDGINYEAAGTVPATGGGGVHNYTFMDAGAAVNGLTLLYYRLKQLDIDGHFVYSKTVVLSPDKTENVNIYPNPASDQLQVMLIASKAGIVHYRVVDNSGRAVVYGAKAIQAAGNINFAVAVDKLSSGVYYLDLRGEVLNKTIAFVKHKE